MPYCSSLFGRLFASLLFAIYRCAASSSSMTTIMAPQMAILAMFGIGYPNLLARNSFQCPLNAQAGITAGMHSPASVQMSVFRTYHPRSSQTWAANCLRACSRASRRDSTLVRPTGGLVSGNLHRHRLQAYPLNGSTSTNLRSADAAIRGLSISALTSSMGCFVRMVIVQACASPY
jgi:hypothetical protein